MGRPRKPIEGFEVVASAFSKVSENKPQDIPPVASQEPDDDEVDWGNPEEESVTPVHKVPGKNRKDV